MSTRAELIDQLAPLVASRGPYTAVVCRLGPQPFEPFDAELLAPLLPQLQVVVSAQSGYDDFHVDWMTRQHIWFANTRNATSNATADMAMFLMLANLRNSRRAEKSFRAGHWRGGLPLSRDLDRLKLGIVGMGCIGSALARKATALGMQVQYFARNGGISSRAPEGAMACESLQQLLQTSDVVSLHCPLTKDTHHMIGKAELAQMKPDAYLINTSRGGILDSNALISALESHQLAGAGLDVFENEPAGIDPYFFTSDKVIVQPHLGGLTEGSFERAEIECLANIKAFCETGRPRAPVNSVTPKIERSDSGVHSGSSMCQDSASRSYSTF